MKDNHDQVPELWVRVFKKEARRASVNWQDCVIASIAWGWIDGQKKPLDEVSYLQRLTPRKAKSNWSQKNKEHAERLIAEGNMSASGMRQVEKAKADGRWNAAYAGQAEMEIPADFLEALETHPVAKEFFQTLDRKNLYPIYYRLKTAKKPETRAARMQKMLEQLDRMEKFH
ncbi:MAG: YdeI/OmpD-associated family protein [Pseudomonadota bacterium]